MTNNPIKKWTKEMAKLFSRKEVKASLKQMNEMFALSQQRLQVQTFLDVAS